MQTISHGVFTNAFNTEMRNNFQANQNQEIIFLGAIQLYWKHNKNVSYLNHAMQYARGRRGIRVNAARAFLETFSGAVFKQGSDFVKAGRKLKECPAEFNALESWLDWANKEAPEPEYNLAKEQLKIISFMQARKKAAEEHGEDEMAGMLAKSIADYAQLQKRNAEKVAVAS